MTAVAASEKPDPRVIVGNTLARDERGNLGLVTGTVGGQGSYPAQYLGVHLGTWNSAFSLGFDTSKPMAGLPWRAYKLTIVGYVDELLRWAEHLADANRAFVPNLPPEFETHRDYVLGDIDHMQAQQNEAEYFAEADHDGGSAAFASAAESYVEWETDVDLYSDFGGEA